MNKTYAEVENQLEPCLRQRSKASFLEAIIAAGAIVLSSIFGGNSCSNKHENNASNPRVLNQMNKQKESIFDRKVHLEDLVLNIPRVPRLCDEIDGLEKQRVDIGDCELYVEQHGKGTPIVLIHGGPGATHHYFHTSFSRAKEFARVIYYDQRGCGLSGRERGKGYSIDQAVNDLENLRKALNIDNWVVLGHSYGGFLAQCYAAEHPESLKGLVFVCSALATQTQLKPPRQSDFLSEEERAKIRDIHRNQELSMAQKVFNAFLNGDWKRQSFYKPSRTRIAQTALYEWDHDEEFRNRVCQQIGNIDLEGAFKDYPIPTMIIEGRWDLTWNTDKAEIIHSNHLNSRLEVFEKSSHSPFEDQPEEFFARLYSFISGLKEVQSSEISRYKSYLSRWKDEKEKSIEYIVRNADNNHASYQKISENYSEKNLEQVNDSILLLKLGFALYDSKRYSEALAAFKKMGETNKEDVAFYATALTWQGHLSDLLGNRKEAVSLYKQVKDMNLSPFMQHSQFGMIFSSEYAAKRMEEPFQRVEVK